jgi:hypothetical protein
MTALTEAVEMTDMGIHNAERGDCSHGWSRLGISKMMDINLLL